MRILVTGLGSIGRRHVKNLRAVKPDVEIAALRRAESASSSESVDAVFTSMEDALSWKPDCALVTNPASFHIVTAQKLAENGVHLFIEKPISNSADGVKGLIDTCRNNGLVLMVGYNLRFDRSLNMVRDALVGGAIGDVVSVRAEAGQYLPDWRPGADYRTSPSASREQGGGAILELSHELDYVRWLVGDPTHVVAHAACRGGLGLDVEDTAEILLQFEDGVVGSVHVDMLQRCATRVCRIVGTEGTLAWDGITGEACMYTADSGAWRRLHEAGGTDRNDMYLNEVEHFLSCVAHEGKPLIGGEDAAAVLGVALAAKKSASEGVRIEVKGL